MAGLGCLLSGNATGSNRSPPAVQEHADVRSATVAACYLEESADLQLRMLAAAGGDAGRIRAYTREEGKLVNTQMSAGVVSRAWEYYSIAAEQRRLGR